MQESDIVKQLKKQLLWEREFRMHLEAGLDVAQRGWSSSVEANKQLVANARELCEGWRKSNRQLVDNIRELQSGWSTSIEANRKLVDFLVRPTREEGAPSPLQSVEQAWVMD